jgi:hypothetical protein
MRYIAISFIVLMFIVNMSLVMNKTKKVVRQESSPQETSPSKPQLAPPSDPISPKQEVVPIFVEVPIYRQIAIDSVLSDVVSHIKGQPFRSGAKSTQAHETAHGIHSELRNSYSSSMSKKVNGFYVLQGRGVIVEEPKIRKSQVNYFVPENLRSYRWQTYFIGQNAWDDTPTYIMDEWSAYVIGGKSCVDDYKKGTYKDGWTDGVSGCLDFSIYTLALCMAIEKNDPDYWKNNTQFKSFVSWQLRQACDTFVEGRSMDMFKWDKQDLLLKELLTSKEAEPFRKMLKQEFDGVWLDIPTKVSLEDEQYEDYQTVILSMKSP